jgi:hypothetical protein
MKESLIFLIVTCSAVICFIAGMFAFDMVMLKLSESKLQCGKNESCVVRCCQSDNSCENDSIVLRSNLWPEDYKGEKKILHMTYPKKLHPHDDVWLGKVSRGRGKFG